ncbi:hypothetical protein D1012_21905 [Pseudotabrizicola alkalilacus]|uniref:Uncharacterized protein n=2 Tax=Pseudotabrizicola alkalilacus TaxID=2305252 RepID=A0A411YW85_9RHOB|nr:hypothetical protein D1012_21905 [Pseudotabrizicola alkalilacus]
MDYIVVLTDPTISKLKITDLDIGELLGTKSHSVINFIKRRHFEFNLYDKAIDDGKLRALSIWDIVVGIISVYYLVFDADDVEFISDSIRTVVHLIDSDYELEVIYSFVKFINVPLDRLQHRRSILLQEEGMDFEELLFSCFKAIQRYYLCSFCSTSNSSRKVDMGLGSIFGGQFKMHLKVYKHYLAISSSDPRK